MATAPHGKLLALALSQFGAFTRDQARALGFSNDQIQYQLDKQRWIRVAPRVYVLPEFPASFEQRAMVAHLHAGPGSFLSFRCGALLRKVDGVFRAPVEITVPRPLRSVPSDINVHYSTDATVFDWSMVGPLPVATIPRILLDLASTSVSLNTLERIYECGARRGEVSYATLAEAAKLVARKGKPGTVRMRELLDRIVNDGKRNGSDAETLFFQVLRDAGLPLPTRQKMVLREDGSHAYTDYAYDDVDAVLEVLGYAHHSQRADLDHDAERNNDLNLQRKTLLEFTWTHLTRDREYIVRTVRRLLRAKNRTESG